MTDNARRLAEAGHLPPRISIAQATDILWTYSSPEVYALLVERSGWNLQQYSAFIAAHHHRTDFRGDDAEVTAVGGQSRAAGPHPPPFHRTRR